MTNKYEKAALAAKWLSELAKRNNITIVTATQPPRSSGYVHRPMRDPSIPDVIIVDYLSLMN